jgi:hypothetical protein
MWHVRRREERRTEFWWRNLSKRDLLEDLGVEGRIIIKCQKIEWDRR